MSKPEDVVAKVKRMKQPAVAITEHGNVYSAVKVFKLCEENNVKFIYGCEMYITEDRFVKDPNRKYYHLTVLAKNEQGRRNINKLVSLGFLEGFYFKPRIDHKLLEQYKEGLVVLSGCFVKDTKVLTTTGLKNIQDIESGDVVITHTGKKQKVAYPTINYFDGDIYTIKTKGSAFPITATDNHKFFVIPHTVKTNVSSFPLNEEFYNKLVLFDGKCSRANKQRYKKCSFQLEPKWKEAKDLTKQDVLLTPIDEHVEDINELDLSKYKLNHDKGKRLSSYKIPLGNDLIEVLGLYVAEGSVSTNNYYKITFSLDSRKQNLINKVINTMEKYFGCKASITYKKDRHSAEVSFNRKELAVMFADWFGEGSANKKIPDFIKWINPKKQMHFIKGAFKGDGSYRLNSKQIDIRYVTTSKQLIFDLSHILHRNWINPCLSIIPEKKTNDGIRHKEAYVLQISGKVADKMIKFIWEDKELDLKMSDRQSKDIPFEWNGQKYMKQKVEELIKEPYKGKVYCLNVEIDNSFVAEGVIVHNCMASELQRTLANEGYEKAKEVARRYHKMFGEDYYLEVQSHRDEFQQKLNRQIVDIGKELGIPWVVTADSHYVDEDDHELHSIFIQIGTNREAGETYQDTQLQSEEERIKTLSFKAKKRLEGF